VGVLPDKEHPISRGGLCIKGWNAASFVGHPDRLKTPLIRRGDGESAAFEEATWDEALGLIAEKLMHTREEFGPDSIGFLASAKCTNEENYLIQKLARAVIKTNNIDHCARL
jgi:formate dehydrogenase major subunit/formate dehydrogenase alpha subunit